MGLFDGRLSGADNSIGAVGGHDFLSVLAGPPQGDAGAIDAASVIAYATQRLQGLDHSIDTMMRDAGSSSTVDTELSMIQLQSVVSQRQEAVQMATQLLQSMNDSAKVIAANIRDGGPSSSAPAGDHGAGATHQDTPVEASTANDPAPGPAEVAEPAAPPIDAENPPEAGPADDGAQAAGAGNGGDPASNGNDGAIVAEAHEPAAAPDASGDPAVPAGEPGANGEPVGNGDAMPAADAAPLHGAAAAPGVAAHAGAEQRDAAAVIAMSADDGSDPHAAGGDMPAPQSDGHGSPVSDVGPGASEAGHGAETSIIIVGGQAATPDDAGDLGHDTGRGGFGHSFWDEAADSPSRSANEVANLAAMHDPASSPVATGLADHGLTATGLSMADLAHGADMTVSQAGFDVHDTFAADEINPQPLPPGAPDSHAVQASHFDLGASHLADIGHLHFGSFHMHG